MQIYILIFVLFTYLSFINSKFTILSIENHPYVICTPLQLSSTSHGFEINLIRKIFQQMNLNETIDYEFICLNNISLNSSNSNENYNATIGGFIKSFKKNPNVIYSDSLISKGFAIIIHKRKETFFYSKIVNIQFYALFFVLPLCFGVLIFLFNRNGLGVFHYIWTLYGEIFFVKPIINIERTYTSVYQGFLRFLLLGLLLAGIMNYLIISKGYYNYSEHLSHKKVNTFAEYAEIIYSKNAFPAILDSNMSIEELENSIFSSEENDLFGLDYFSALYYQQKYTESIEIIYKEMNIQNSVIEFSNSTQKSFIKQINLQLKNLRSLNYQNNIVKEFFSNQTLEEKTVKMKQLSSFYLLWIIFISGLLLIILFKFTLKILKKYFPLIINFLKTMDILQIKKEINTFILQESINLLTKFSLESMNFLKHIRETFLKRQFYNNTMQIKLKGKPNLMRFSSEINKSPRKAKVLKEAHKSIQLLEKEKYYESNKFLKKKKRKFSILKSKVQPSILKVIPLKNKVRNLRKNEISKVKNQTLYEVILNNIQKTAPEKNEKKFYLRDSIIEDEKILENLQNEPALITFKKTNNTNKNKNKNNFKKALGIELGLNQQKTSKNPTTIEKLFKEDLFSENQKEEPKSEKNSQATKHNLPYVSQVHNSLKKSNNSILERYKSKLNIQDIKNEKIVEIEEEKEYVSSVSRMSDVGHFFMENQMG